MCPRELGECVGDLLVADKHAVGRLYLARALLVHHGCRRRCRGALEVQQRGELIGVSPVIGDLAGDEHPPIKGHAPAINA